MRTSAGVTYLHGDHLGSTNIASAQSGTLSSRQTYYAFGAPRTTEGTLSTDYTFTGQKFDATDGLMYYNARYYDAALNRFIQPDSIIPDIYNPQSLNRYAYVRNNPVRYTDPTGHAPCRDDGDGECVYGKWALPTAEEAYDKNQKDKYGVVGDVVAGLVPSGVKRLAMMLVGDDDRYEGIKYRKELTNAEANRQLKEAAFVLAAGSTGKVTGEVTTSGLTVLGQNPEYVQTGNDLKANIFNIPKEKWDAMTSDERWSANAQFCDECAARRDVILLATPLDQIRYPIFSWAESPVFIREVNRMLYLHDYSVIGRLLIPPSK